MNIVAKVLCFIAFAAFSIPAANACLTCYLPTSGPPAYCTFAFNGGEVCVQGMPNRECATYFQCQCDPAYHNCTTCPPSGCIARFDMKEHIGPKLLAVNCQTVSLSREAKIAQFLKLVDSGQFSGENVRVFLAHDGEIHHALTNTIPLNHWQKWAVGFETNKDGKRITTFSIRTKTGHDVSITLM